MHIVVKLSGGHVIGIEGVPANAKVEVRQYHADFQWGEDEDGEGPESGMDEGCYYEVHAVQA